MQQTTTYKLNLIETDDVFSPEPLNQNTQKVEAVLADAAQALADETAARQSADTAGTAAWQSAVSAEAAARQSADAAEATARQNAITSEAAARQNAIAAETAARQKAVADEAAARQSAIATLARHKFACGSYTGNGETYGASQTIQLPFTPTAVLIPSISIIRSGIGICLASRPLKVIEIVTGGFVVRHLVSDNGNDYDTANNKGGIYPYLAFA